MVKTILNTALNVLVCYGCVYSLMSHDLAMCERFCFVVGYMGGIIGTIKSIK